MDLISRQNLREKLNEICDTRCPYNEPTKAIGVCCSSCFIDDVIEIVQELPSVFPMPEGFDPENLNEEDKRDILDALEYLRSTIEPCVESQCESVKEIEGEQMDRYGYIGIETLLNFCENSKDHAITPNDFMRMKRVRMPSEEPCAESQRESVQDLIRRQDAIDAADRADYTGLAVEDVRKVIDEVIKELKQLSSVKPEKVCIANITLSEEQIREAVEKAKSEIIQVLQSAEPEIHEIDYRDCSNAMLKMWIDNVLTDGEYNRIMDKLNVYWAERRTDE